MYKDKFYFYRGQGRGQKSLICFNFTLPYLILKDFKSFIIWLNGVYLYIIKLNRCEFLFLREL